MHTLPEHGRAAARILRDHLVTAPDDLHARWLLNLAAMVTGEQDALPEALRLPPDALRSEVEFPEWVDIAPSLGVAAFDLAGGAVMDDFDGDGLLDLVSSSMEPCSPLRAYRNDGRGGFEDVAAAWGLDSQLGGLNLVHADYDGDGKVDLLVLRGAWLGEEGRSRNSLLRNDLGGASGRFLDVTAAAGLAEPAYPTQTAAWADYDGDGDLDLYVGNEGPLGGLDEAAYGSPVGENFPSQLFRNDGEGTFTDVGPQAGVSRPGFAKGVTWGDYDDDGDPDLYVSSLGPNHLYRNEGGGAFSDVTAAAGVVEPAGRSFATWFFDYDNDGDLDLFVATYNTRHLRIALPYFGVEVPGGAPIVYRNDGGAFTDVSAELGLDRPLLPMGANYGDLDNDGFLDVYLGTGAPELDALMPNIMYKNVGGQHFEDVTFAGGFGHLQKGHGIAFGDLDNDGDQDLFARLGGAYPADAYWNALWENPGSDHHWLVLRLQGAKQNRHAIGARVEVHLRDPDGTRRSVHLLAGSGGSFGDSSLQQEIGLGNARAIEAVVVRWPGRAEPQLFDEVEMDRFYLAVEGAPRLEPLAPPRLHLGASAAAHPAAHEPHP